MKMPLQPWHSASQK